MLSRNTRYAVRMLIVIAVGTTCIALAGCASPKAFVDQRSEQAEAKAAQRRSYTRPLRAWNPHTREREHWRRIITKEWLSAAQSVVFNGGEILYHGKKRGTARKEFVGTVTGQVLVSVTSGSSRFTSMTDRVVVLADGTIRTGESGYTYVIRDNGDDAATVIITSEAATWNKSGQFYALRPSQKTVPMTKTLMDQKLLFPDFDASAKPAAPPPAPEASQESPAK